MSVSDVNKSYQPLPPQTGRFTPPPQPGNSAPQPQIAPPATNTAPINPNWSNDPDAIATLLGSNGYTPGYDSNVGGSFQSGFNTLLGKLSPDQLVKRYGTVTNQGQFQTQLDQNNALAYKSFTEQIGRAPTSSELSQILPAFQQSPTYGNAILANMKDQLKQDPNSPTNQAGASKYADQINQVFQSQLGRAATSDEINHFGGILGTGNLDAYGLQSFLQGTPEYQKQQDTSFRNDLSGQLDTQNLNFFNRAKQDVIGQFMQNGTSNSSALDSALADLMGQFAQQKNSFLTNLSAQQYGSNKDLALGNYSQNLNSYMNNQNYNRNQSQNNINYLTGRSNQVSDYQTQKSDYENYMNQNRPSNALNNINTGLNAIGTGAKAYSYLGA